MVIYMTSLICMSIGVCMDIVEISQRFKFEREKTGYNQASAARAFGISREALRNIENAQSDFKISILLSAASLGMDAQYILTGVRSDNAPIVEKTVNQEMNFNNSKIYGVGSGNVVNINQTKKIIAQTNPGEEHISVEQRAVLKKMVDEIVETEQKIKKSAKTHRAVWSSLNAHCKVNTYSLIRFEDFDKARKYLHQWVARLNSAKNAPINNADNWRNKRYSYIKINSKQADDSEALKKYISRNFGAQSISELSNDELEKTYRYIAGRRNKRK